MSHVTLDQVQALNRFALANGRDWRSKLHSQWNKDNRASSPDDALLRQLRNAGGPEVLATFKPNPEGWSKVGTLLKDSQERFNLKRGWRVSAWRITDLSGQDLVQPWSNTKSDAQELARRLNIFIQPN